MRFPIFAVSVFLSLSASALAEACIITEYFYYVPAPTEETDSEFQEHCNSFQTFMTKVSAVCLARDGTFHNPESAWCSTSRGEKATYDECRAKGKSQDALEGYVRCPQVLVDLTDLEIADAKRRLLAKRPPSATKPEKTFGRTSKNLDTPRGGAPVSKDTASASSAAAQGN